MSDKKLKKSADKKLCGVCGGLAEYLDMDPTIVRIIWIIFTFCGGAGIIAYIIAALLMPNS